jgi:hypothetical protein
MECHSPAKPGTDGKTRVLSYSVLNEYHIPFLLLYHIVTVKARIPDPPLFESLPKMF